MIAISIFSIALLGVMAWYRFKIHKPILEANYSKNEFDSISPDEYCTEEYVKAMQSAYGKPREGR